MAKTAPNFCFLFYVGDWLGGTQLFTREHKGAYIDLLMAQFGNGHMSLEDIKHVLGEQDYVKLWPKIEPKFTLDEDGLLYNIKLDNEKFKRKKFVDGRNKNLMGSQVEDLVGSHLEDLVEKEKEKETKDVIEPEDVKDIAPVKPKKPKKEKEPKIQYADNVLMTVGEYNQIITKYFDGSKKLMNKAIDKLDAYKLSNGKTYKSDAGAIRTWVAEEINKTQGGKVSSVTESNLQNAEKVMERLGIE